MKIWHDDIRVPPDPSWWWARTNDQAKWLLEGCSGHTIIEAISLDHDLGLDQLDPSKHERAYALKGNGEETGDDLVAWMVEKALVPDKVVIHSWNPSGAARMLRRMRAAGYRATYEPYRPRADAGGVLRRILDELGDVELEGDQLMLEGWVKLSELEAAFVSDELRELHERAWRGVDDAP